MHCGDAKSIASHVFGQHGTKFNIVVNEEYLVHRLLPCSPKRRLLTAAAAKSLTPCL
jgi:hypothetical protein